MNQLEQLDREFRQLPKLTKQQPIGRRKGYAGGGALRDEVSMAKQLRKSVAVAAPPASVSPAERDARKRLASMERKLAKFGAECRISQATIERQRAYVAALATGDVVKPVRSDVAAITWLPAPVPVPGSAICAVGYDSKLGPPAWLAAAIETRDERVFVLESLQEAVSRHSTLVDAQSPSQERSAA